MLHQFHYIMDNAEHKDFMYKSLKSSYCLLLYKNGLYQVLKVHFFELFIVSVEDNRN